MKPKRESNIGNSSKEESSKRRIKSMESPIKLDLERKISITKADLNCYENKESNRKDSIT